MVGVYFILLVPTWDPQFTSLVLFFFFFPLICTEFIVVDQDAKIFYSHLIYDVCISPNASNMSTQHWLKSNTWCSVINWFMGYWLFFALWFKSLYLRILKLPIVTNSTELVEKLLTITYSFFFFFLEKGTGVFISKCLWRQICEACLYFWMMIAAFIKLNAIKQSGFLHWESKDLDYYFGNNTG